MYETSGDEALVKWLLDTSTETGNGFSIDYAFGKKNARGGRVMCWQFGCTIAFLYSCPVVPSSSVSFNLFSFCHYFMFVVWFSCAFVACMREDKFDSPGFVCHSLPRVLFYLASTQDHPRVSCARNRCHLPRGPMHSFVHSFVYSCVLSAAHTRIRTHYLMPLLSTTYIRTYISL